MHDRCLHKRIFFAYAPTQQNIRVMSERMQKCVVLDLELLHIVPGFLIVVFKMFPNRCSIQGYKLLGTDSKGLFSTPILSDKVRVQNLSAAPVFDESLKCVHQRAT